jgi:glycerophosphoryl diester phosphodiesterase
MAGLDWLTARPIAHRGLHSAVAGVIENTASAFSAAIAGNYGIETDLQISADGEAMVHHDDALGRLTDGSGRLADMSAAAIKAIRFKASPDRILSLSELCELVAGRATLVLELKSRFDGDLRLARCAADVLANYAGPVAVMSFDPALIEAVRIIAPGLTRGIVAERMPPWASLLGARPQFVAYGFKGLPAVAPLVARWIFGLPLLTWTVRTEVDRRRAERWADQVIFETMSP